MDLTGATVRFHMKETSGDVDGSPLKVDAAASIVSAAAGTVKYDWQAEDTDASGWFRAEWEVTFSDGTIRTFPNPGYTNVLITGDLA